MNLDLWGDFDNQQAAATPTPETARHKPAQRFTEQAVLSSLRDWLLHDYVASYCRSLQAMLIYRRCYWIDALGSDSRIRSSSPSKDAEATPQKGRKKSTAQDPPPLLQSIASLSRVLAGENPSQPITLHGIVLETRNSKRRESKAAKDGQDISIATNDFVLPKESGMLQAGWPEIAGALLEEIEQSPAIFLLNPFGQTLYTYDDLLPIYRRTTAPTELCLFISHKQARAHVIASSRTPAGSSLLTGLLRTDQWKTLLAKGEAEAFSIADGVIDLLRASMQKHFPFVQRIPLFMPRPASIEKVPYTLLFASRSKDSLLCMNDAVCRHRRQLEEQSYQGILGKEWFAQQRQERLAGERQELYKQILQQGRIQRVRRWPELRQKLLLMHFGRFILKEYDDLIRQLLFNGLVHCQWKNRLNNEGNQWLSGGRVPGNDDVLIWS